QAVADAALAAAESVVAPAATIYGPMEPRPVDKASHIEIVIGSSTNTLGVRGEALDAPRPQDRRPGLRTGYVGIDPPLGKRALASAGLAGYMRMGIARKTAHPLARRQVC